MSITAMVCPCCNHKSKDVMHDYCHAHTYCVYDYCSRYYLAPCAVRDDLWEGADVVEAPDSHEAFLALKLWIKGFIKNSKYRQAGQDYWVNPDEKASYAALHTGA